jgi:hypothetical protein
MVVLEPIAAIFARAYYRRTRFTPATPGFPIPFPPKMASFRTFANHLRAPLKPNKTKEPPFEFRCPFPPEWVRFVWEFEYSNSDAAPYYRKTVLNPLRFPEIANSASKLKPLLFAQILETAHRHKLPVAFPLYIHPIPIGDALALAKDKPKHFPLPRTQILLYKPIHSGLLRFLSHCFCPANSSILGGLSRVGVTCAAVVVFQRPCPV